jgi:hypothetical protein
MRSVIGLCEDCGFHSVIASERGETFHLCKKSKNDSSFPKYPRLPVVECRGFEATHSTTKRKQQ